jgi:glucosamine--fructose-6-phosphate aminotransferase (isomerizing)
LFEEIQKTQQVSVWKLAVQVGLKQRWWVLMELLCLTRKNLHDSVVVARLGSPLAIGLGEDDFFVGSDATPFLEYTQKKVDLFK